MPTSKSLDDITMTQHALNAYSLSTNNPSANETPDTKAAKRVLLNNIKWLQARIELLDLDTAIGQQMFQFYSSKINLHQHCLRQINAQGFYQAA